MLPGALKSPSNFIIIILIIIIQHAVGQSQPQHPEHPDLVTDVPFQDCGSEFGSLTMLRIDPPCGPTNCTIKRGEPATIYADILPRINSTKLRAQISQIDPNFGFSTNLFPEFDPCGRFNISCPMVENEKLYSVTVGTFPTSAIPLTLNVKIKLMTEDYKTVVCGAGKMVLT